MGSVNPSELASGLRVEMRMGGIAALLLCSGLVLFSPTRARGQDSVPEVRAELRQNVLAEWEVEAGWVLLFDGTSTAGWREYGEERAPVGWQAVDGALTRVGSAGDIISLQTFSDFELTFEWKLQEGGNSGVFLRAIEGPELIYHAAPEMQILDNDGHRDGRSPLTSTGSNYALHPAPEDIARPLGEWNQVKIIVEGAKVEHWVNGQKVVEYELWTRDWKDRVAASKFSEWPEYGMATSGHIGIQDHGSWVAFRNMKIRPIG